MARNQASATIAEAIEKEMADRGITRSDVLDRIGQKTGTRPGRQWSSRTFSGNSHFTVQVPSEFPNELLEMLAEAIDPGHGQELAYKLGKLAVRQPEPAE